ncbi:hypothetical protein RYR28_002598 [Edwardsiella piscicida]|uniref:hypothetical protein n=1 Tax=Edwardsiella piscicida TaxID=1263550 RepID=UPI0002C0F6A5|nr:hypothetical protein [Edwardsiella piscicida]AGH75127.1 hypothetical protein ETAC_15030 [Edwardsiella piscicida C07-087]EKS7781356.1 hypothetical protein [Edwardsiella piscicida]EKS7784592.1 hypothetical protein [Edwardsiella piscicida]EKS7794077.1 hypothetical protein [Edwardsiella piscicida]EKS7814319.1 hypothetical protein [Edwardsiella piscicida]
MRLLRRENRNYNLVALLGGAVSGTLTAALLSLGTLCAGRALPAWPTLMAIGIISALSSAFAFLLSHYAGLRDSLLHAEHQLNLTVSGRLASGVLGRKILRQTLLATLYAAVCYLLFFSLPFLIARPFPALTWLPGAVTLLLIAVISAALSRVMQSRLSATLGLVLSGFALCVLIGTLLRYR